VRERDGEKLPHRDGLIESR